MGAEYQLLVTLAACYVLLVTLYNLRHMLRLRKWALVRLIWKP